MNNRIIILGASGNPERNSYLAGKLLEMRGYRTIAVPFSAKGDQIKESLYSTADTVSIFLTPGQQKKFYTFLMELKPRRLVFNPGTENEELIALARSRNIQVIRGCTIAMLVNSLW